MIIYGTKINSTIHFPLSLPCDGTAKYELTLSNRIPVGIKKAITCGFPLYFAHGRKVYLFSNSDLRGSLPGQPWHYKVSDLVSFYWKSGEPAIYYEMENGCTIDLLSFWFIHLVLPFFFTLENMYNFLHGGAIAIQNKAIVLIAPSMGGKSTLTNSFLQHGHTLLSDDKIPTYKNNTSFFATGSHPYYRPYRNFEELGILSEKFQQEPVPIHAFYSLRKVEPDDAITINEINGFRKFDTLAPNLLYTFDFMKKKRLSYLSHMLHSIKAYDVQIPWDLSMLSEVTKKITMHCRATI